MPSRELTIPLSFAEGLNEYAEVSVLPDGFTAALQNWIPEPSGGVRVPRAWTSASATGITGTRTIRGIGYFVPVAGAMFVMAQATSGTQYKLVYLLKSGLAAGTITTIETVTSSPSTRPLAMASGMSKILYCSPEFPSQRIRSWDGTTAADVSTDAIAGRTIEFHNNRFFVGGSTANPTLLYWTELGDEATWTIGTNFQPIGEEDGEPIEDLASWDRGLMIGKESGIWYLTGFGPDTFAFHPLDGGGVAPGRTLVPTPSGVIAIGRRRVWEFTGGGYEPISHAIENSYGMTGNYMSGTYMDGYVYVCDEGSGRVWCLNLATRAWHTEIFSTVAEGPGILFAKADYLLGGVKDASTNSLLLYRQIPGTARGRIPASAQPFIATTGQTWINDAKGPYAPRHLYLQFRQRGGTSANTDLTIKHYVEGTLQGTYAVDLRDAGAGVYRERVSIGAANNAHIGYSHQFEFTQTVGAAESSTCDIEGAWLEGEVQESR